MIASVAALNARTWASVRMHRNFRLYLAGQIVSFAGSWMQNIALVWYVVEVTGSPVAVGLLMFLRLAPFTLFGLLAGVLADRFDNRSLLAATQVAQMAVSAALAFLAFGGVENLALTYVLAFAGGVGLVVESATRHAFTYQMVGPAELPNAVALSIGLYNVAAIGGPAIAGLVIAVWGVGICFVVNTVSFLAVLAAIAALRPEELHALPKSSRPRVFAGIAEGFAYARRTREVRIVLLLVAALSLMSVNYQTLLPLLVSETMRAGPEVLGILSAVFGVGAAVGALVGAAVGRASRWVFGAAVACFGLGLLVLAPLASVAACALLLAVVGGSFAIWSSSANALVQLEAPDELRGRVISLYLWAFAGLAPVSGVVGGWLVEVGGTRLSFAVSGAAALGVATVALAARADYPAAGASTVAR